MILARHAYLIMSHQCNAQLKHLLELLDYELNDIYIFIDKKCRLSETEKAELISVAVKSKVIIIKQRYAAWGGDSLMKVEMDLLRTASQSNYAYYHLLSGSDLPLKSQAYIHDFFDRCTQEYILLHPEPGKYSKKEFMYRFRYYYFFQNIIGRWWETRSPVTSAFAILQRVILYLQKKLNVNRAKNTDFRYVKSSQWFSLTHSAVLYVISQYPRYKKYFLHSYIPDESFIQTIIYNSPFKEKAADDHLRLIDWDRGTPYTFTWEDFDMLKQSDKLFARKFDSKEDERCWRPS